jgi:hypothetical protein
MATLMTVKELISFIKDGNSKWLTLVTACSNEEVYSNWCFNLPYEFEQSDVTLIDFENDHIKLQIL